VDVVCEVSGMSKGYRSGPVLDGLDLRIGAGEMVAIVGPSGSGKSTLLNIIGLLESVDSGSLSLFGTAAPSVRSAAAKRLLRKRLAYLFQNYALIDSETVESNLKIAQEFTGGSRSAKRRQRHEVLGRVGLAGAGARRIYELSGGEQQRVAIARVLLKPCDLVLADEPTGSLDTDNRDLVLGMLGDLNAAGKTIVVVTHDPVVAAACTRVVALRSVSGAARRAAGTTPAPPGRQLR